MLCLKIAAVGAALFTILGACALAIVATEIWKARR